jgi:hypothetical protein
MGDFTGATGTFMGEITRSGAKVRWRELGLVIGKLCEKTGPLAPVTEADQDNLPELSHGLESKSRICGSVSETPVAGQDQGWVILGEHQLADRWNISLREISDSLQTEKMLFNKFPRSKGPLVFNSRGSLICLGQWRRRQAKLQVVLQSFGGSAGWINNLPSTHSLAKDSPGAFPYLTHTFRTEKRRQALLEIPQQPSGDSVPGDACVFESCTDISSCVVESRRKDRRNPTVTKRSQAGKADEEISEPSNRNSRHPAGANHPRLEKATSEAEAAGPKVQAETSSGGMNLECRPPCSAKSGRILRELEASGPQSRDLGGNTSLDDGAYKTLVSDHSAMRLGGSPLPTDGAGTSDCPEDDGISRFFIAEAYQGELYRKESVSILRRQQKRQLEARRRELLEYKELQALGLEQLKDETSRRLERFKESQAEGVSDREKAKACGLMEIALEELVQRELGVSFPGLVGLKQRQDVEASGLRPLRFRTMLGDEEATAVEAWWAEDDDGSDAVKSPLGVRRVKAAMTFIHLLRHLKKEGVQWSFPKLWKFDLFKKHPLSQQDLHAVHSLVPHLYWTSFLKKTDIFRVKPPDMKTGLFVPTARVSRFEESLYGKARDEEAEPSSIAEASFLAKPLRNVRISAQSLCSLSQWDPSGILESASAFFKVDYSHDLHPEKTRHVRLYVRMGVDSLLRRLSNPYRASYLSSISTLGGMDEAQVAAVFASMKEKLRSWYKEFSETFASKWSVLGEDWTTFIDESETGFTKAGHLIKNV